jgi:hypothetical protein
VRIARVQSKKRKVKSTWRSPSLPSALDEVLWQVPGGRYTRSSGALIVRPSRARGQLAGDNKSPPARSRGGSNRGGRGGSNRVAAAPKDPARRIGRALFSNSANRPGAANSRPARHDPADALRLLKNAARSAKQKNPSATTPRRCSRPPRRDQPFAARCRRRRQIRNAAAATA